MATAGDPSADHGRGPSYADITALTIDDSKEEARIIVRLAGVLPGNLADGEVQGVGIDFYRTSSQESDYQVFLDGGTPGWRAFLQTPEGFIGFPGSFTVAGQELTVVLPWSALGGREDADVAAFADWSSGVGSLSADGTAPVRMEIG